jgi:hypothetical protein
MTLSAASHPQALQLVAATVARHVTFNADFYITAATVIPVLYLALTVQGTMFPWLVARLGKALEKMKGEVGSKAKLVKLLGTLLGAYTAMTAAALIITAGVVGEIVALLVLVHRHDSTAARQIVFDSTVGLLVFTAAGPIWALNTAWVRLQWIPLRTVVRALRHNAAAPESALRHNAAAPEAEIAPREEVQEEDAADTKRAAPAPGL